jgi:hypothetical protein
MEALTFPIGTRTEIIIVKKDKQLLKCGNFIVNILLNLEIKVAHTSTRKLSKEYPLIQNKEEL